MGDNRKIHKYEFDIENVDAKDCIKVDMPLTAKIISVGSQQEGHISIWAVVDPDMTLMRTKKFAAIGPGESIKVRPEDLRFMGTVMDGPFVWHIFQVID